ncbi:MAG: TonB-dependent receptor [Bacteroidetes bacterium]|nr:MAG: TonB-dependent receptor [Bacteroidota bacterium]
MFRTLYIPLVVLALFAGSIYAQPSPLGGKDTLVLENERIEDIVESEKPFQKPPYQEIPKTNKENIQYSSKDVYVATEFEPAPPDIREMDRKKKEVYTHNFIKVGVGRYVTPLVQVHAYSGPGKDLAYGLDFTHLSAHQDKIPLRRFREDYGSLRLGASTDEFTLGGRAFFYNTSYFNYADTVFSGNETAREDSLGTGFTRMAFEVDLFSNHPERTGLHYNATAGTRLVGENRGSREGQFFVLPNVGYRINDMFSVDLLGNLTFASGRTIGKIQNRLYVDLAPRLAITNDALGLNLGFRFNYFANSLDTANFLNLGPDIQLTYEISPDAFTLLAGYTVGMTPNFYNDLIAENRYLGGSFLMKPTVEKMHIYLGARGSVNKQVDFSARLYYKRLQNALIYRTGDGVYFQPAFDSLTTVTGGHFEVNYDLQGDIKLGAALNVNVYNTSDNEGLTPVYFHATPIRLDVFGSYVWKENLTAKGELLFYGPTPMFLDEAGDIVNRGVFPNVNASVDYRITKGFSVFLWVNNLLNVNYQRWYNYPERRIDFRGGVTVSF